MLNIRMLVLSNIKLLSGLTGLLAWLQRLSFDHFCTTKVTTFIQLNSNIASALQYIYFFSHENTGWVELGQHCCDRISYEMRSNLGSTRQDRI